MKEEQSISVNAILVFNSCQHLTNNLAKNFPINLFHSRHYASFYR